MMIELNLLPQELRRSAKKFDLKSLSPKYFLYILLAIFGIIIFVHICLTLFIFIQGSRLSALNKKWQLLAPQRSALEDFRKETERTFQDSQLIQRLLGQRITWAEKLDSLSRNLPSGVWFEELSLNQKDIILKCSAVSVEKMEFILIDQFLDNLKKDKTFYSILGILKLGSTQKRVVGSYDIIDFTISGALKSKK